MKQPLLSLLLLLSLTSPLAAAQEGGKKAPPVSIEADRLELDQGRGVSHYLGNVVMSRGSLSIRADKVTLHTENNKLKRAVASGKPVTLVRQPGDEGEAVRAEANEMEYLPSAEQIKLRGNARLWRDGNEFSGEQIDYNLKQQVVRASGDREKEGRVRVILQPEEAQ